MCLSGVTCLSADCCFSEVALEKSDKACWSSTNSDEVHFRWIFIVLVH